jgi:hypothetical protein
MRLTPINDIFECLFLPPRHRHVRLETAIGLFRQWRSFAGPVVKSPSDVDLAEVEWSGCSVVSEFVEKIIIHMEVEVFEAELSQLCQIDNR